MKRSQGASARPRPDTPPNTKAHLELRILPQPDDTTCGPTCLHAVYDYYGERVDLARIISEVPHLEGGGTLAVLLAIHALKRGYRATMYTYNIQMWDPTWFSKPDVDLSERLRAQMQFKRDPKLHLASRAYLEFLELGGEIRFEDLTRKLIRRFLDAGLPLLTGLSSTYLYRTAREYGPENKTDDIRGEPEGHFVVLCGYDQEHRKVRIADPLSSNPNAPNHIYEVGFDRLIGAILLGNITYDATLLLIEPMATE